MRNLLTIALVFLSANIYAQNSKVVSAYSFFESYKTSLKEGKEDTKDLLNAKESIDAALKNEKTKDGAKTWYYKGIVESLLSQSEGLKGQYPNAMQNAIDAFSKCLSIKKKNRYVSNCLEQLSPLGNVLFNDAAAAFNAKDFKTSYEKFAGKLELNEIMSKYGDSKMALDTSTIQNTAIAASRAGLFNESAKYYALLYKNGVKSKSTVKEYLEVLKAAGDNSTFDKVKASFLKENPDDQGFLIDEINQMLASGNLVAAVDKIKKAIIGDPKNASLQFVLGNALKEKGDYAGATMAFQKALDLKPDYFDAVFNLGTIPYNEAAEKIKLMNDLGLDEQSKYDALKSESNGLFNKALPYFTKALTINKGDKNTLKALKEIYARLENYTELKKIKGILGE